MTRKIALMIALDAIMNDATYANPLFDGDDTTTKEFSGAEVRETLSKMVESLSNRETSNATRREKTAAARRELMAKVTPAITAVLPTSAEEGRTVKEIFEAAKINLPSDFTANKVQYVLLHDMVDIVGKTEAKGKANTYYRITK